MKNSVVNQYGKGDNNIVAKVCEWMNENTKIIGEDNDNKTFIFGVSKSETINYIKELKGQDIKDSYIYSIYSKAIILYRYYNEGCVIKWIE